MDRRIILTVLSAATALLAAGCNGPTKAGLEARAEARDQLDSFTAQFTYDQAKQDFEVGQFDRALTNIDNAIAQAPNVPRFFVLKGRIFFETDRLERALDAFSTAIEMNPQYAEAHYFLGIVHQRWSDDNTALEHYQAAYELQPDHVEYLLATAETWVELGSFDQAQDLVNGRLAYFEHNPALRHLLGQIALLQGDPMAAAELYGESAMLDPDNMRLLEELTWVQYEAGLYDDCVQTIGLLQAKLSEERLDLTHLHARCLTLQGNPTKAQRLYTELSRRDASNPSVWIEFGTLSWKTGDFRRVAECSLRAIELSPNRYEGYLLKGQYERHLGHFDNAIDLLRQASDLSTESALPHLLLGRTLEESGQSHEALNVYAEALELDPGNGQAQSLYAALERKLDVAAAGE